VPKAQPIIVGIDEAGRGALAGPVVAGACVLTERLEGNPLIRDSKQLSEQEREEAFAWITAHCTYGVGIAEAALVDAEGILGATERAMQQAVADVAKRVSPTYLLVDGRDKFWFDYSHSSIVRGDVSEPCISAASIVAKVTRDRLLCDLAKEHPLFGFEIHKGYGTPEHLSRIRAHGVSPLHRRTFLTRLLPVAVTPPPLSEAASRSTRGARTRRGRSARSRAARA
jgi:ribonuclease HII